MYIVLHMPRVIVLHKSGTARVCIDELDRENDRDRDSSSTVLDSSSSSSTVTKRREVEVTNNEKTLPEDMLKGMRHFNRASRVPPTLEVQNMLKLF